MSKRRSGANIEPNLLMGHSDYHLAVSRTLGPRVELPVDSPSSILGGEAFLARIYDAIRSAASPQGSNAYNTTFFIGWDEPGGTYDHVPPGPVPPPDPSAPAGHALSCHTRARWSSRAVVSCRPIVRVLLLGGCERHDLQTSAIETSHARVRCARHVDRDACSRW